MCAHARDKRRPAKRPLASATRTTCTMHIDERGFCWCWCDDIVRYASHICFRITLTDDSHNTVFECVHFFANIIGVAHFAHTKTTLRISNDNVTHSKRSQRTVASVWTSTLSNLWQSLAPDMRTFSTSATSAAVIKNKQRMTEQCHGLNH